MRQPPGRSRRLNGAISVKQGKLIGDAALNIVGAYSNTSALVFTQA